MGSQVEQQDRRMLIWRVETTKVVVEIATVQVINSRLSSKTLWILGNRPNLYKEVPLLNYKDGMQTIAHSANDGSDIITDNNNINNSDNNSNESATYEFSNNVSENNGTTQNPIEDLTLPNDSQISQFNTVDLVGTHSEMNNMDVIDVESGQNNYDSIQYDENYNSNQINNDESLELQYDPFENDIIPYSTVPKAILQFEKKTSNELDILYDRPHTKNYKQLEIGGRIVYLNSYHYIASNTDAPVNRPQRRDYVDCHEKLKLYRWELLGALSVYCVQVQIYINFSKKVILIHMLDKQRSPKVEKQQEFEDYSYPFAH